uniref:Uncharacterized protein n=1 Tax=Strigamia maritima TaxID=126957 RepID=T1IP70_STRMM
MVAEEAHTSKAKLKLKITDKEAHVIFATDEEAHINFVADEEAHLPKWLKAHTAASGSSA